MKPKRDATTQVDSPKVWRKGLADTQSQLLEELTVRLASKKRFGSHVFCEIRIVDMSFEIYEHTVRSSRRVVYETLSYSHAYVGATYQCTRVAAPLAGLS